MILRIDIIRLFARDRY